MKMDAVVSQLIEPTSNTVLADISSSRVTFTDKGKSLEANLKLSGINIPSSKRAEYMGRSVVQVNDPKFSVAFVECYFPLCLKESGLKLTPCLPVSPV